MTEIGILGTGRMAVRLAAAFARAGRSVVLGSRTPQRAKRIVEGLNLDGIVPGDYKDACNANAVLPAMFLRDGMLDTLKPYAESFSGKLYIDISNPFNDTYTDFILPWDWSGAEEIQRSFPKARVVGAFKNVWWEVFDRPEFGQEFSDVYVVSDHVDAKRDFLRLADGLPFRFLDSGALKNARTVERMTLLSGELGQRYKFFPRMNYRLLGDDTWVPGQADTVASLIKHS